MNIKSLFLTVIFCFLSSQVLAKDKDNTLIKAPKIISEVSKHSLSEDIPKLENTDLSKVFAQAEKYFQAGKSWKKLRCTPVTGFICTKWKCAKRDTETFLILDKKKERISRCEGKTCDTFPAEFRQTGVFYNVQTRGPIGTLIRILGDSRYKEITTVGLDAYVANGNCEVID